MMRYNLLLEVLIFNRFDMGLDSWSQLMKFPHTYACSRKIKEGKIRMLGYTFTLSSLKDTPYINKRNKVVIHATYKVVNKKKIPNYWIYVSPKDKKNIKAMYAECVELKVIHKLLDGEHYT